MLFTMLGLIIVLILAFLILRPRPAGNPPAQNPAKTSLPISNPWRDA